MFGAESFVTSCTLPAIQILLLKENFAYWLHALKVMPFLHPASQTKTWSDGI